MMLLMMLLTATTAWAEGVDYIPNGVTLRQANFTDGGDNTYTILNAAGWDAFCDALLDNDTYNRFIGKTVKLAADITVTSMAGASQHDFMGTFDGQEHTLTFNYNTDTDDAAPFRYVEDGCVIKDLRVCGTIQTSAKYAAGLVAHQYGNVTIRNCRSSVTIKSSFSSGNGDGTHGGFVAQNHNAGDITFEGCLFDGKLLTTGSTATTRCGGFVGWRSNNDKAVIKVKNSLYAPASPTGSEMWVSTTESATFVRDGIASDITNSYYTSDFNDGSSFTGQGKKACPAIAAPVGEATHTKYTVSGITPYTNGLKRTIGDVETFYYGGGENVSVSYVDESGTTVSHAATALSPANMPTTLSGWYYVADNITYTGTVTLGGDVNLILADDKTMSVGTSESPISSGYGINGNSIYSLTIYGQSAQSGTLNAYSSASSYAVYLKNYAQHGGTVTIDASNKGALRLSEGNLTLTRGSLTVNATGTNKAIDLDDNYGVTVSGGTLNATGNTAISGYTTSTVLTMTGGTVNATGSKYGISGRVTFSGGNLTANGSTNGTTDGICSNVTLSWTRPDDSFTASSFGGTVTITDGQAFTTDGTDIYMGKLSSGEKTAIAGKTLRPKEILDLSDNSDNTSVISANNNSTIVIQLSGRTLYKDGDWNTLCLPFALSAEQIAASPLSGATIMELDGAGSHLTNGTLTLNFNAATEIEAGRPYIVKWPIDRVINKPSEWHDFAADVAGGNTYEGKIVRLAADIEVSEMVGTKEHKFKGFFDGQGHTLTLSSLSASGFPCAPFLYVEGATIANLHTTGTVKDVNNVLKYRSGLVGWSDGNTTIHNCWSSVTIKSSISGSGNHGGFIGKSNSGNATISNCLFDGSFDGSKTTDWGGFVGSSYSTTTIRNSVFAPAKILIKHLNSATFSPNNVTTTNCYYSQALNNETNGATAIGSRSADDLAADLGSGWQVKDGKAVPVTATPGITNPVFSGTVPSGYTSAEAIATALVEASSKSTYVDNAFRGYFQLNGISASDITEARMNFDEQGTQTGIGHTEITERADAWYSLDGRKLDGKPTSKGLYIHGNKKVVVE